MGKVFFFFSLLLVVMLVSMILNCGGVGFEDSKNFNVVGNYI